MFHKQISCAFQLCSNVSGCPAVLMSMVEDDKVQKKISASQLSCQNVKRQKDFSAQLSKQKLFIMSTGCQKAKKTGRQTDRQKDRWTDRQKDRQKDKTTFQLSYQNKSCSGCKQDVRKIERQVDRKTDVQTERQIEIQRLFSLVIKTKVCQNVNRMSERQ